MKRNLWVGMVAMAAAVREKMFGEMVYSGWYTQQAAGQQCFGWCNLVVSVD